MTTSEHSEPGQPLAVPLSDQLGLVVDAAALDCWKANYGLEKTPAEIAAMWGNWAPSGAILALRAAVAEIERLRAALAKANEQAERFERGWYLRGDALEKLEQWARAYPLKVFPEPLREEWQRAAALLSKKGLSLDRMSASNMRHVISGVRETVAEGLKA